MRLVQNKETTRYWECQYVRLSAFISLIDCTLNSIKDATPEQKLEIINRCLQSCLEIINCANKGIEWEGK